MPATLNWCEDHGAPTGSPAHGTTRDGFGANTNYSNGGLKNADDTSATLYSASKINPGSNAYEKYFYGKITGTFNSISNMRWSANCDLSGVYKAGVSLKGKVSSTYNTPGTTLNTSLDINFTNQVFLQDGPPVKLSTVGPEDAVPTDTLTAPGYTQYLVVQMQVAISATSGAMNPAVMALVWDED